MIRADIVGLTETLASLQAIAPKLRRKVLRPALSRATKPLVQAAKKFAARRSGLLAKSIKRKVRTYKNGGTLATIIGPDSNLRKEVTRQAPWGPVQVTAVPAFYAHLVEFGTRPHSLAKGDQLARTGPGAEQSARKRASRIAAWSKLAREAKDAASASKYLARINTSLRRAQIARTEKQSNAQRHPGSAPKPFMRPALDTTRDTMRRILAEEVLKGLQKLAKR